MRFGQEMTRRAALSLARAVVPPPRLRAFPLAFDASDAGCEAAMRGTASGRVDLVAATRIDAAGSALAECCGAFGEFGSGKGNQGNQERGKCHKLLT